VDEQPNLRIDVTLNADRSHVSDQAVRLQIAEYEKTPQIQHGLPRIVA
jgi:hypothetical protein